jgi:ABC-type multidrug transport system ATPase subunit
MLECMEWEINNLKSVKSKYNHFSGVIRRWLYDFLELPSEDRIVRNLSGGQQRRLSLAVALLHNPELLVLDEPTVGVDPLLRLKIWDHLRAIAVTGVTIIITTHYIGKMILWYSW